MRALFAGFGRRFGEATKRLDDQLRGVIAVFIAFVRWPGLTGIHTYVTDRHGRHAFEHAGAEYVR